MESSRGVVGGLSKSFSVRNLGLEEHRLKSQQEFLEKKELANGKAATDLLSGYGSWEQNGAAIQSESDGSFEAGSSPVFDESFYMGPTQLEAELQATSDAIEEMEGKVAIRLMVAEAVLTGIVKAVEVDASEAVEVSKTELLKVKQELQEKDSTVIELINSLKKKEEELDKLVEDSRRKEHRLIMDMLTERERILGKIEESDKYVAQKEKELLKMAEHMVELSLNLAAESKRVNVLEKQIKESKEAESRKGRELLAMMEKAEQFRAEKESMLEMVRREARLKELRLTESLAGKEEVLRQQQDTIRILECAEQQLREEVDIHKQKELELTEILAEKESTISQQRETIRTLEAAERGLKEERDVHNQKDIQLTETLSEKERILSEQLEMIRTLKTAEQQLREEVDGRSRKELQLSGTLAEKEKALSEQLDSIKVLETAKQKMREEVDIRSQTELHLSETLAEKERVRSQQLEAISTLEIVQKQLREELDVRIQKEEQLLESLMENEKRVTQHLQTIKTLETSEQQLREDLDARTQKELELTQGLKEKEHLVREQVQTIRSLEFAEAELKEKLNSESTKVQILSKDLTVKERELSSQLEIIESLQLTEKELREVAENQGQKERFLMAELREKDELISKQRTLITTLESTEMELGKEAELQCEKVSDLLKSGKETAEVLDKLKDTVKFHADTLEEKDRSLRFLQGEIELLNCKIEDLSSVRTTLIGKIETYEAEVENQRLHIVKQEGIIRESEIRCEDLSFKEKLLQDEVASLNEGVLDYKGAAQLAQEELQEQSWKYETETTLIMTTLEGSILDLEREINLLGEKSARSHSETVTFRSRTVQRRFFELSSLRSLNLTLEAKLSDAQAALEVLQETVKKQEEEVENKDRLLEKENSRTVQLEQKLIKGEGRFQDFQNEMDEMKMREENFKKQKHVLEGEVQRVRHNLDRASLVEQELRAKDSQLQILVQELEGKVWMLEFENMFISSYVESCSREVLNLVAEVNKRSAARAKRMVLLQLEAEAAGVELTKSKGEINKLRSELCSCVERMQSTLASNARDLAEARAGLQTETANSERLKAQICELHNHLYGSRKEFEVKLSRTEEEAMHRMLELEESKWQSEVESLIVMGLAEGSIQKLMECLTHARGEMKIQNEDIGFLRSEVEQLIKKLKAYASDNSELKITLASKTQELCAFKTDFVLENAMQRDALLQAQTEAKEALKKIEELKRLKSTLLERIHQEKQRWVQMEESLAEQKWKYHFEMDIVSTVMYEAEIASASMKAKVDNEVARLRDEHLIGDDYKKTDSTARFIKGKPGSSKMEVKTTKAPLSKLDLLVRENDELRREKEQLLTEKTEEIYKLKREFYKELEKVKIEKKKDYDSDRSQKDSPKSRGASEPRQRAVTGAEVKQNDDCTDLEMLVADHERKFSAMRATWDAEKSTLEDTLCQKEEEIKELLTKLSLESQAQLNDYSEKLEKVVADHESEISELRALRDAEKTTLLESLSKKEEEIKELVHKLSSQSQVQQNDEAEKAVADHGSKNSEVRALWDAEKATLLESLFKKEDEIKELVSKLSSQSQAQQNDDTAKLEKVVADHERKVGEMRALWDAEKSAVEEQIKRLITELTQALEKEKESVTRQASLEEKLAAVEEERGRLKALPVEEISNSAAVHMNELDVKTRQLVEAVKDAQEKSKRVGELNDEVSVLRSELSSVRKQMESEVQSMIASFFQLERGMTQRTKQCNLRLRRADNQLNHLARQWRWLVSNEVDHMQNLQNLQKAEAEVDLLGDEVDTLTDVLEKVYTVLTHYHPVIQHYPGLADLAKVVKNEALQGLQDSNDVSL